MWAAILAAFPTIAGWINLIVGWFQAKEAAQTAANTSESNAEADHQNDGLQSVSDKTSSDAQNAALDAVQAGLENPTPVVVTTPEVK